MKLKLPTGFVKPAAPDPEIQRKQHEYTQRERLLASTRSTLQAAFNNVRNKMRLRECTSWEDVEKISKESVPLEFKRKKFDIFAFGDFCKFALERSVKALETELVQRAIDDTVESPVKETRIAGTYGIYTLRPQQEKSLGQLVDALLVQRLNGAVLGLDMGDGKTIVAAAFIVELFRREAAVKEGEDDIQPPFGKVLFLTDTTLVLPTMDKIEAAGLRLRTRVPEGLSAAKMIDARERVVVTSYSQLSANKFQGCFKEETIQRSGNDKKVWRYALGERGMPLYIFCDESSGLKHVDTVRCERLAAFHGYKVNWIFMSGTAAVVVNDTEFMTVSMKVPFKGGVVTTENFSEFAHTLAEKPDKPNEEALVRWRKRIGARWVKPPADPRRVKAINHIHEFEFKDEKTKLFVAGAIERYVEAVKRTGKNISERGLVMAQFTIMRRTVEVATCPVWIDDGLKDLNEGFAVSYPVNYVSAVRDLVIGFTKNGYSRSDISIIWGAEREIRIDEIFQGAEYDRYTQIVAEAELNDRDHGLPSEIMAKLKKTQAYHYERRMRDNSVAEFQERNALLRELGLFKQTQEQRYEEVKRYLRGDSKICIYTLASGGKGIDLDHSRKEARPRRVRATICYWPEEWAQAMSRHNRKMTLTDTDQYIYIPRDTILSRHVGPKLARKMKSMRGIGAAEDLATVMEKEILDNLDDGYEDSSREFIDTKTHEVEDEGEE